MGFTKIDLVSWPRREHYAHYISAQGCCTYSVTVSIDITDLQTALKVRGLKTFPSHLWLFSRAVNEVPEFRMALNREGNPGIFDQVNPRYNVFNKETKTFGGIWTPYTSDFRTFYDACVRDMNIYRSKQGFSLMNDFPDNIFDFSCLPWVHFNSFNLNIYSPSPFTWLAPQITIGKFVPDAHSRLQLPLSVQVHHAVCDGYHVGLFVESVQSLANNSASWIK